MVRNPVLKNSCWCHFIAFNHGKVGCGMEETHQDPPTPTGHTSCCLLWCRGRQVGFSLRTLRSHSKAASCPQCPPHLQSAELRRGADSKDERLASKGFGQRQRQCISSQNRSPQEVSCILGWPQLCQVTEGDLECLILLTTVSQG